MDVVAKGRQRGQARSEAEIGARGGRNPVALRNAVAVEPEDKAALDRAGHAVLRGFGRVGRAGGIEHADQGRQSNLDRAACQRESFQKTPARQPGTLSDYVGHWQVLLAARTPARPSSRLSYL